MSAVIAASVLEQSVGSDIKDQCNVSIVLKDSHGNYTGGQAVEGVVYLQLGFDLPARAVTLSLQAFELAYADAGAGRYGDVYTERHTIVHEEDTVWGSKPEFSGKTNPSIKDLKRMAQEFAALTSANSNHAALSAGKHSWHFSFKLPHGCPSDYISKYGSKIEYAIHVEVDIPFAKNIHSSRTLTVYEHPQPDHKARVVTASTKKEFLFDRHPLTLSVGLSSNELDLGSTLHAAVSVDNRSAKSVRGLKISLWAKEIVRPENNEFEHRMEIAHTRQEFAVAAHGSNTISVPFKIPLHSYPTIKSARLIEVSHFLRFTLDIPWALDLDLDVPIELLEPPDVRANVLDLPILSKM